MSIKNSRFCSHYLVTHKFDKYKCNLILYFVHNVITLFYQYALKLL